MKKNKLRSGVLILVLMMCTTLIQAQNQKNKQTPNTSQQSMVRLSEIEIHPEFLAEYSAILKEESRASIEKEPGVIAIFPMAIKDQPNQIRIIEIYADSAAYKSHLKTPHFQHYKTTTLKMVKALKLVDMNKLDEQTMPEIFKKLK